MMILVALDYGKEDAGQGDVIEDNAFRYFISKLVSRHLI